MVIHIIPVLTRSMAITITAPAPPPAIHDDEDVDYEEGGVHLEGDVDMELNTTRGSRRRGGLGMVTPGETVTDDPQWMRCVRSCTPRVFAKC